MGTDVTILVCLMSKNIDVRGDVGLSRFEDERCRPEHKEGQLKDNITADSVDGSAYDTSRKSQTYYR